jgi:hypothetical protein
MRDFNQILATKIIGFAADNLTRTKFAEMATEPKRVVMTAAPYNFRSLTWTRSEPGAPEIE